MKLAREMLVNKRAAIIIIILLLIPTIGFVAVYKPFSIKCGNGVIDLGEKCDSKGCSTGSYCSRDCKCAPLPKDPLKEYGENKLNCEELGGFLCKPGEVCTGVVLNAIQPNCCSAKCGEKGAAGNSGNAAAGEGQNTATGNEAAGATGQGAGTEPSSGQGRSMEFCEISTGDIGVVCEDAGCSGMLENNCCVGVCPYEAEGSFEVCYNRCMGFGIYPSSKCGEMCSKVER